MVKSLPVVFLSAASEQFVPRAQRDGIAMRQDDVVYFIHADHLGSTSLTTGITGTLVAETRYLPYGEERWITGTLVTDFTFTGQRAERGFGLMDYNARYYDPWLGRFISPDSIIPGIGNPQALDRYVYTYNNPLKYDDPSGHCIWVACLAETLAIAGIAVMVWYYEQTQTPEFQQAVQDIAEQVGTVFNPPSVPPSDPDAFPLGPPPDPYSPPGVELDVPDWPGLPGVPLDQPDTGSRAIDFPLLDQPGIGDNVLSSGPIHKNSLDYVGETHVYRIVGPDGTTYKIGQSAQGVRVRDSASIRAEQQVRKLLRKTGQPYRSEIRKVFPDKRSAREYETRLIERFRRIYGEDTLPGNLTNR